MEKEATLSTYIDMYHEMGLNLLPIYDTNREGHPAKTVCIKWTQYQKEKLSAEKLHKYLAQFDTNGIAILCGSISDRLEVIDIDSKHKPGIDAILFSAIKSFYPELFDKLRIHRSPSGGYHILYRILEDVPGSFKLAGRPATAEELLKDPDMKVYNFLETRGEKAIALAPPSVGYTVHKDNPIPVITWEERCSMIDLCKSYTQIVKYIPIPKAAYDKVDHYSTNPFDDYNKQFDDPIELMEEHGWAFFNETSTHIYFTRPGKDTGNSASWMKSERCFYMFTSSTEGEIKGYLPSTMRGLLQYDSDFKAMRYDLVKEGYGVFKPEYEFETVEKRVLAGREIPENFSTAAKEKYAELMLERNEKYPHGEFLRYNIKLDRYEISREDLYRVAKGLGFRLYESKLYRIEGFLVHHVTEREFQDGIKAYINEEDDKTYVSMCNSFESFMQTSGAYTAKRIEPLEEHKLLHDTANISYKFYNNGYLLIDKNGYTLHDYEDFDHLVWADKVQHRDFKEYEGGRFVEFINLALTDAKSAQKVLGFLAHEYKDETTGYAIILCEECENPKSGGGSGKNVFCNLLKLTTTYTSKPASQTKLDEKFFQSWDGQRVMGVSDTPKDYDFKFFKEPVTGEILQKKLYKDEVTIPVERTPKFIFQTNYSFDNTDGGLERRIIPVEFTNFFTRIGGLDVHFGVHFPKQWSTEDYNGFDTFIAKCISMWIAGGLKLVAPPLTHSGWIKQFRQTHGEMATGVIEHIWAKFSENEFTAGEDFRNMVNDYYIENGIRDAFRVTPKKLNDAIDVYADKHGFKHYRNETKRVVGGTEKGHILEIVSI